MKKVLQFGKMAVKINMAGILLSGLFFPLLTAFIHPQPKWQTPDLFIASYHWLQTATFFFGYLLVTGSVLTFIALYFLTEKNKKIIAFSGLAINIIFSGIVILNYIIQTTWIPYLAFNNPAETKFLIAAFTMSNPGSLAWALEMYGWGGIGLSFIFMSFTFESEGNQRILRTLFLINGITSVGSAILTSVDMNWIFSPAGFGALITWNTLVFIIDLLLLKYFSVQLKPIKHL